MLIIFNLILIFFALRTKAMSKNDIHIFAKFMECSDKPSCETEYHVKSSIIKNENSNVNGEEPELRGPSMIKFCQRKLYISLTIDNEGKVSGDDDFIVIDDAMDPVTGNASSLLKPIVIKLHREQPQIFYPTEFLQTVNGRVREKVVQQRNASSVCDLTVCDGGKAMGISKDFQGFCCYCDKNDKRSKRSVNSTSFDLNPLLTPKEPTEDISPCDLSRESPTLDTFFHFDKLVVEGQNSDACHLGKQRSIVLEEPSMENNFQKGKIYLFSHPSPREKAIRYFKYEHPDESPLPLFFTHDRELFKSADKVSVKKRRKRKKVRKSLDSLRSRIDRVRLNKVLAREGKIFETGSRERHECPLGNSEEVSSTHCVKRSNLWYSVYSFNKPIIVQDITAQVFQKRDGYDGSPYWVDLTRGSLLRLGTYYPQAKDELPSIALSYSTFLSDNGRCDGPTCPIDPESNFLLVPSHIEEPSTINDYPEAKGGAGEYMVVNIDDLSLSGLDCDKVGTSFEGFKSQPDVCNQPEGSCLGNQPIDLWISDLDRKMRGERGIHFLESFGEVSDTPLASAVEQLKSDYLAMEYTDPFMSRIEVEIRADDNALLREGWNLQIQSITADSSSPESTHIDIAVINFGLVASYFRPWLLDCSSDLPSSAEISGASVFIAPLQRHLFRIGMEGTLPTSSLTCTVEIHNDQHQRVSSRQVLVKKQGRCLCAFHCACFCLQPKKGVACTPLMQEEYAAAGYTEGLPQKAGIIPAQVPFQVIPISTIVTLSMILLLLGKLKVLFGFSSSHVRIYGLNFLRNYLCHCLPCFKESSTDEILHRMGAEIFLNMFFFVLYPMFLMWQWLSVALHHLLCCIRCLCCCGVNKTEAADSYEGDERKVQESKYWKNPGGGRYLEEEEDFQYVRDTLEAMKEHLENRQSSHNSQSS